MNVCNPNLGNSSLVMNFLNSSLESPLISQSFYISRKWQKAAQNPCIASTQYPLRGHLVQPGFPCQREAINICMSLLTEWQAAGITRFPLIFSFYSRIQTKRAYCLQPAKFFKQIVLPSHFQLSCDNYEDGGILMFKTKYSLAKQKSCQEATRTLPGGGLLTC